MLEKHKTLLWLVVGAALLCCAVEPAQANWLDQAAKWVRRLGKDASHKTPEPELPRMPAEHQGPAGKGAPKPSMSRDASPCLTDAYCIAGRKLSEKLSSQCFDLKKLNSGDEVLVDYRIESASYSEVLGKPFPPALAQDNSDDEAAAPVPPLPPAALSLLFPQTVPDHSLPPYLQKEQSKTWTKDMSSPPGQSISVRPKAEEQIFTVVDVTEPNPNECWLNLTHHGASGTSTAYIRPQNHVYLLRSPPEPQNNTANENTRSVESR